MIDKTTLAILGVGVVVIGLAVFGIVAEIARGIVWIKWALQ